MGDLGAISLWMALVLAAYSTVGSVAGKLRGSAALVESAQAAMYATVVVLFVSTLSLVVSFIARDFEIAYVARHSDLAMPDHFTWVAFYAGNEGSLLYIAMVLSVMAAIAVWRAPEKVRDALPYTTGILMLVLTFFLAVMAFMANPFDKLPFVPPDGEGINPLLTHFGMFFHPPALMAGLVGISVPFLLCPRWAAGAQDRRRVGGPRARLGHHHMGAAGQRAAAGFVVGLHHPRLGRLLVLGPGGKRGLYALAGPHRLHSLHNGAEAAGDVPNVEHCPD